MPCFRQRDILSANKWCEKKGIKLVIDPLISSWDKMVNEKGILITKKKSDLLKAKESFLFNKADFILADTDLLKAKESGEIKSCTTSDGKVFMAEAFLLSSGAWASSILEEYRDNVFPIKGQMIQYPNTGLSLELISFDITEST